MKEVLARAATRAAGFGLLLGAVVLVVAGPPATGEESRRVVVTAGDVERLRHDLAARLGRWPSAAELRAEAADRVRDEVFFREALARGYDRDGPAGRAALVARMEALADALRRGAPPTDEELRAYHALRPERYGGAWDADPTDVDRVRERVAAELDAEARAAAREQYFHEVAESYRIVVARRAQAMLADGAAVAVAPASGVAAAAPEAAPAPAGYPALSGGPPAGSPSLSGEHRFAVLLIEEIAPGDFRATLTSPPSAADPPSIAAVASGGCRVDRAGRPSGAPASAVPAAPSPAGAAPDTAAARRAEWRLTCSPPAPAGATLGVNGLADAGLHVHFEVLTLAGRWHAGLLTAEQPEALLPPAPVAGGAVRDGAARTLAAPEVWLLVLAGALLGFGRRALFGGALGFGMGQIGGAWLAAGGTLAVSAHLAAAFALLVALAGALESTRRTARSGSWLAPTWLPALFVGALYGGVTGAAPAGAWLTRGEHLAATVLAGSGAGLAVLLVGGAAFLVLRSAAARAAGTEPARLAGLVLVMVTVMLLVPRLAALALLVPTGLPRVTFEVAALGVVAGFALPAFGLRPGRLAVLVFALLVAAGAGAGVAAGYGLARIVVLGGLAALAVPLALRVRLPARFALPLVAVTALGHGWHVRQVMDAGAALPIAVAAGAVLVAVWLFHVASAAAEALVPVWRARTGLALGGLAAALVVLWRLAEYRVWVSGDVAAGIASGELTIPVPALALAALAALLWPRRRRVPEALGIRRRAAPVHLAALGLAFFLLPVGTVAAPNPLVRAPAVAGDEARRIVAGVLENTYLAFNLEDGGEAYERLSENVTGELVANLYLDSRRRLTAGTAEGDRVTVREVRLVGAGGAVEGSAAGSRLVYEGQWAVTATVRHLQHAHDRQNLYSGRLVLRLEQGRWKLADVELTGEDRILVDWSGS